MGMVEAPASFFGIDRLPSNKAPPKIGDLLLEGITRQQFDKLSGISAETLARIVYFSLRENGPKVMVEAQRALLPIMGRLMFSPKEVASAAHVGALAQSLAPEKQVERLSKFNWQIISIGSPSAILPDCVCISRSVDGWGPLFQISSEELDLVVFPLTPEKLAVGGRDETSSIALADYNQAAASACLEFFLSSNKHPELIIHHAGLGGAPQAKNVPCH
jgi:hypothetical protein